MFNSDSPESASSSHAAQSPLLETGRGYSIRAFIIGGVFAAVISVLVTWGELVLSSARIGYLQLPPAAIGGLLIFLGVVNGVTRALNKKWRFNPKETAIVYVMCLISAMTSSRAILEKTIPLLVVPNYAANHSNNWAALLFNHIPHWAVPWNPNGPAKQDVAKQFYEKLPPGGHVPWNLWLEPCLAWGLFWAFIVWAFICLTVLIRKQWADNEKLSFPLAQLPIEMMSPAEEGEKHSFWRNPIMWLGALVPIVYFGIDWAHQFQPSIPLLPACVSINDYLAKSGAPWNQLDYTPIIVSFAAIGFFYLLPSDMIFSIWFFFAAARLSQMALVRANMDLPRMPIQDVYLYQGYQCAAAYLILTAYFIWSARPHLARVWKAALSRPGQEDHYGDDEMISYKSALWGLAFSLLGASVFLVALGMTWWFAIFELICIVVVIGIIMARSTAEGGMMMTEVTWAPVDLYSLFGNIHGLGASNLVAASFTDHLIGHDQRGVFLAGMLDSSKISDAVHMKRKSLLTAILAAIIISVLVGGALQIYLPYTYGGQKMDYWMESLAPQSEIKRFVSAMAPGGAPMTDTWQGPFFFVFGALMTIFLVAMRSLYAWWPLHPLGYALAGSWSTIQFWFPAFVAWIFKSLSIRYGGIKFYVSARPFFLGMIVGEFGFAMASVLLSVIVFWATGQQTRIPAPPFPWQ